MLLAPREVCASAVKTAEPAMRTRGSGRPGGDTRAPSTQAGARPTLRLAHACILPAPAMVISYASFARSAPDRKMSTVGLGPGHSGVGLGEHPRRPKER